MSHLLQVTQWDFKATQRGAIPLALEFPVEPSTAPYLVMTSKGLLWIEAPLVAGQGTAPVTPYVKTAVREADLGTIYAEIIQAVLEEGRAREWGNVQSLTREGLAAAIDHLAYYDLTSVDILVPAPGFQTAKPKPAPPPKKKRRKKGAAEAVPEVEVAPLEEAPPTPEPEMREAPMDLVKRMGLVGLPYQPCSWLPPGRIVVVPKDRTYLGVVGRVTVKSYSGLVHNASRGIAIAVGE